MMEVLKGLVSALNTFGPAAIVILSLVAAIAFFMWRDCKREEKYQSRVEALERKLVDTVLPIVTEYKAIVVQCQSVIESARDCIAQNSRIIERLIDGRR